MTNREKVSRWQKNVDRMKRDHQAMEKLRAEGFLLSKQKGKWIYQATHHSPGMCYEATDPADAILGGEEQAESRERERIMHILVKHFPQCSQPYEDWTAELSSCADAILHEAEVNLSDKVGSFDDNKEAEE